MGTDLIIKDPIAVELGRRGGRKSGGGVRPGAGRKPTCHCGECRICKRRRTRQAKAKAQVANA